MRIARFWMREKTSLDVWSVKIDAGVFAVGLQKNQKTSRVTWCPFFAYLGGGKRGNHIVMKFCMGVRDHDVIIHANLGDDRLIVVFWASHFSIDLYCRP